MLHDEAYHEFCGTTAVPLLAQHRCLVISRTFSKAFGLAGLRMGYLLAHEETARLIRRVNNTNHVTMFGKEAGLAALRDLDYMKAFVQEVNESKEELYRLLARHQVHYYPSSGNYVLIRWPRTGELCDHLKGRHIFVRDKTRTCNNVGHVRVTVGGKKSSAVLLRTLAEYFSTRATGLAESRTEPLPDHQVKV
jgi:histidinol-phosphate aminotransferase